MSNEGIKLGQAMNQATEILCSLGIDLTQDVFFKQYKELVKRIYVINLELETELITNNNASNGVVVVEKKQISDKQMYCPGNCGKVIPKTWSSHKRQFGGCGWGEQK